MRFSFSLILLLFVFSAIAQKQISDYRYSIGYFGNNLWNEGVNVGMEKLRSDTTYFNKKGKTRTVNKNYAANFGFYNDSESHLGMFLTAGWSRRKMLKNRFNPTSSLQPLGIYRSFLPETYKVNEDGEVRKVFLPGRFYLAPNVSAGIGRMGRWHPDNSWYVKLNITTLLPYSRAIVPLVNIEFGYHFNINSKIHE